MTCVSNAKKPSRIKFFHQALIGHLDDQSLVQLHKMCCKMRAKQWSQTSKDFNDIVYKYPYARLFLYHRIVQHFLDRRKIKYAIGWSILNYRGAIIGYDHPLSRFITADFYDWTSTRQLGASRPKLTPLARRFFDVFEIDTGVVIYPEHNDAFLAKCIEQLKADNVRLVGKSISQFELELAIRGN